MYGILDMYDNQSSLDHLNDIDQILNDYNLMILMNNNDVKWVPIKNRYNVPYQDISIHDIYYDIQYYS